MTCVRRVAYLTLYPLEKEGRTRIIIADCEPNAALCEVRVVHESDVPPPLPRMFWTKDGRGIVLMAMRQRLFAVDIETGETVGGLPKERHHWPRRNPAAESRGVQVTLSDWRRQVAEFIREHGGLYVP